MGLDPQALFSPTVPSPLHFAVLVRLDDNHGSTAKLTSELAREFEALGWCTAAEYTAVTRELIASGVVEGVRLRVNPLLHSKGCARCAAHEEVYARDRRAHEEATRRWEAGTVAYPYSTSTSTLHLRDCQFAHAQPAPLEPTLREFVHCHDSNQRRLVLPGEAVEFEWEEHEPGGQWWGLPYGPPPGDGRVGTRHGSRCLSIREARAWTLDSRGRGRRAWKPCKVCWPIDPFLLDTADTTVFYRADTAPADRLTVEADDGDTTTMLRRLTAQSGRPFGWGASPASGVRTAAVTILTDATAASPVDVVDLPIDDFTSAFLRGRGGEPLTISRADVRAWLREWYRTHTDIRPPEALTVLLDHDLALRPDTNRLSTLRK
ncbi:hypothetical protein [Actinokineospora cianjurensis]|nr:hypothetical protein [Actinokineospora cianjurensis]